MQGIPEEDSLITDIYHWVIVAVHLNSGFSIAITAIPASRYVQIDL